MNGPHLDLVKKEDDTLANCLWPGSYIEIILKYEILSVNAIILSTYHFQNIFIPVFVSEYNFTTSNLCENCLIDEQIQSLILAAHVYKWLISV